MTTFIVDKIENDLVTLRVPGFNYANSFKIKGMAALADATGSVTALADATGSVAALAAGTRVRGKIWARAWKVDRVELGGNYVEPLVGRPRRMQGTILGVNAAGNELTVQVGYEVTVKLPEKSKAADFKVGERIGWDNVEMPTFDVEAVPATVG